MATQTHRRHPDLCDVFHADPARVGRVRAGLPIGATLSSALAEIFKALGDPTRVRHADGAVARPSCACAISRALVGITRIGASRISSACFARLRLVRSRREGRMVFYRLDDDHIVGLLAQGLRARRARPRARRER